MDEIEALKQQQPEAYNIRFEECPSCKGTMLSYQIPGFDARKENWEHCGYWCFDCDFSIAGEREVGM